MVYLGLIDILLTDSDEKILSPARFQLFGGHAPCLVEFRAPNIRFDISQVSWTARLHRFKLEILSPVLEVVGTIIRISTLETLYISSMTSGNVPVSPHGSKDVRTSLPNLRYIELREAMDLNAHITLLSYIEPVDNHNLILQCYGYLDRQNTEAQLTTWRCFAQVHHTGHSMDSGIDLS